MIWHCRRSQNLPSHFRPYLTGKDVIIGSIARGRNNKYERCSRPLDIKETELLHIEIDDELTKGI